MNLKSILPTSILSFILGCARLYRQPSNASLEHSHGSAPIDVQSLKLKQLSTQAIIVRFLNQKKTKHHLLFDFLDKLIPYSCCSQNNINSSSNFLLHACIKDFQSIQKCLKHCNTLPPQLKRQCIRYFIDYHRTSLNSLNNKGWAPLHLAVLNGDTEAVRYLLNHKKINVNIWSSSGFTPLHLAIIWGNIAIAQLLLQEGANVNEPCKHYQSMFTPLHLAAICKDKIMYNLLIECGADVDIQDSFGRTPKLSRTNHTKYFKFILYVLNSLL